MSIPSVDPSKIFTNEALCERVFADHAILRALTSTISSTARAALRDEKQRFFIRHLLSQLKSEVDRHAAFEEQVLVPRIRDFLKAHLGDAIHLEKDHEDQALVLTALCEDAQDGVRGIEELVEEILWFIERFERDMAEEESLLEKSGLYTARASATIATH